MSQKARLLFFESRKRLVFLSPIHWACPKGFQAGRSTAGFEGDDEKMSALQRAFRAWALAVAGNPAEASDEKGGRSSLKNSVRPYPAVKRLGY